MRYRKILMLMMAVSVLTVCKMPGMAAPSGKSGGLQESVIVQEEKRAAESGEADESGFVIEEGVLTAYTGTAAEVVIPEGVTTIKGCVFEENKTITKVTLPSSMKKIESRAFKNASRLTRVEWNEGLEELVIDVFYGCSSLTGISLKGEEASEEGTVYVPKSLLKTSLYNFSHCDGLTKMVFKAGMTKIPDNMAYDMASLETVEIPEGVEEIGTIAFANSGLTQAALPSSMKKIGNSAFKSASNLTGVEWN